MDPASYDKLAVKISNHKSGFANATDYNAIKVDLEKSWNRGSRIIKLDEMLHGCGGSPKCCKSLGTN